MKSFSILILILILGCTGFGQQRKVPTTELKAFDATEKWQYPYSVSAEKRQTLLAVLNELRIPVHVGELFGNLGKPDRIDDLTGPSKPLSHFENGFLDVSKDRFSFRCIWFARKTSKSPGLSDSWLAAYVDKDQTTVSVIHSNYLSDGQGSGYGSGSGVGQGNGIGNGTGFGNGSGSNAGRDASGLRILSKPRPMFTDAGRRQCFRGSVLLRVTFLASGQIGSISAVRGAPYGLTEQAIAAARRIRFEPAKVNGVPTTVTKNFDYSFDPGANCSK